MGLRDVWRSGVELEDVAINLEAFEVMNQVRVEILLTFTRATGDPDLLMTMTAFDARQHARERNVLASVMLTCSGTHLKSVAAALIHGMYRLDSQLALSVLRGLEPKEQ